jgi:mycobactin salicyl-AMP ligase
VIPNAPRLGGAAASITLDHLLAYAAAQRADDIALIDPPDRSGFTGGAPRTLTYAQADRAVTAIAARLRRIGLRPDEIVGLQIPNSVEAVLTFLGVLRAGLIAAPLPLLWRRAECTAAMTQIGAQGIVAAARIGGTDTGTLRPSRPRRAAMMRRRTSPRSPGTSMPAARGRSRATISN